jgi:hypothetical protein
MAYPYYPTYNQNFNPYMQQQMQQPQNQQIQNGGLVSVRSEDEARNYPVAPGNSVTFKNESAPFVYTKTMGFSQLDRPVFERFRLVKEDAENVPKMDEKKQDIDMSVYALKTDLGAIIAEIDAIKATVDAMQKKPAKKEKKDDE